MYRELQIYTVTVKMVKFILQKKGKKEKKGKIIALN
jgi:hypothetical protein